MNRRDRLRIDERRRESHQKNDRDISGSSSQVGNPRNMMDSYFQSQQVIQSLSTRPGAHEINATKIPEISRSFRIPRKQSQPENTRRPVEREHRSRSRDRSPNRRDNQPENTRWTVERDHRSRSRDRSPNRRDNQPENTRWPVEKDHRSRSRDRSPNRRDNFFPGRVPKPIRRPSPIRFIPDNSYRPPEINPRKRHKAANQPRPTQNKLSKKDKKFFNKNKPIQVVIFDRDDPDGKIDAKNVPALLAALTEIVKQKTLSPTGDNCPKFLGYSYEGGVFLVMCANFFSSELLKNNIGLMQPPWPGAALECINESYLECFVNIIVPEPIQHLSEFLTLCKKDNNMLGTEKWRRIGCVDLKDGRGKKYTLGMDLVSYDSIQADNNAICYGDTDVEVELM